MQISVTRNVYVRTQLIDSVYIQPVGNNEAKLKDEFFYEYIRVH